MNPRNPKVDPTPASLIERVKANQEGAWDELARLYQGLLDEWMESYRKHKYPVQCSDAEDIIQDVWFSVRSNFEGFVLVTGRKSFRPWLRTIFWRRVSDFVRKKVNAKEKGQARSITDLAADSKIALALLDGAGLIDQEIDELEKAIPVDDEKEREILLTSALRDISEKTKIDERHLRIFAHRRFTDRKNAEIGEEFGVAKGNVSTIQHRVTKILNEVYGCFLD